MSIRMRVATYRSIRVKKMGKRYSENGLTHVGERGVMTRTSILEAQEVANSLHRIGV
jgi:hypothetical protein